MQRISERLECFGRRSVPNIYDDRPTAGEVVVFDAYGILVYFQVKEVVRDVLIQIAGSNTGRPRRYKDEMNAYGMASCRFPSISELELYELIATV